MKRFLKNIFILLALGGLFACSTTPVAPPSKERKFFGVAVRKLPPEPVYNRLMTAYLPEPLPPREIKRASYSRISPVFQFEMKDATLEETARVLASMARYTSYTSSVIASRKVNLVTVGTIDEVAKYISDRAGVNVIVDHANHEIRFLANNGSTAVRKIGVSNVKPGDFERASAVQTGALPSSVKVSEKTNGFLNNIKIEN
jgi:hypothetical protein